MDIKDDGCCTKLTWQHCVMVQSAVCGCHGNIYSVCPGGLQHLKISDVLFRAQSHCRMMPVPDMLEISAPVVCWLQEVPVRWLTSDSHTERVCLEDGVNTQSAPASLLWLVNGIFTELFSACTFSIDQRPTIHPAFRGWDLLWCGWDYRRERISSLRREAAATAKMSLHDGRMTSNGDARLEGMKVQDPSTPTKKPQPVSQK